MFFEDKNVCKLCIKIHFLPERKTVLFQWEDYPIYAVWGKCSICIVRIV
jgi:hypothetical protein